LEIVSGLNNLLVLMVGEGRLVRLSAFFI